MRRFELHRHTDVSGVSGTGVVADGVRLDNGMAAIRWRGDMRSYVIWMDFEDAVKVHGHSGATRFVDTGEVGLIEADRIEAAVYAAHERLHDDVFPGTP